jgi:hypothetical protein
VEIAEAGSISMKVAMIGTGSIYFVGNSSLVRSETPIPRRCAPSVPFTA